MAVRTDDVLIEQLHRTDGKAEIVNGRIVRMAATGIQPGLAGLRIASSLDEYCEVIGGTAFPDNVGFLVKLPNRKSFSPDAGWINRTFEQDDLSFVDGAPDFAVEVRSEGDYGPPAEIAIIEKIRDYFTAGTTVVWDVDLLDEDVIRSYRANDVHNPQVFCRGDIADAEPAVPGWRFPVGELFRIARHKSRQ